jgi:hypothetical protein
VNGGHRVFERLGEGDTGCLSTAPPASYLSSAEGPEEPRVDPGKTAGIGPPENLKTVG